MQQAQPTILFAGGGTGGHLFPAIAIAEEIKRLKPSASIVFVGTRNRIEARVVPQRGYAFSAIWISGLKRGHVLSNLLFPFKLLVSIVQSVMLMRKIRPAVVVGTGGYVAGPAVFAAQLAGIPTLIQEQNNRPGVTTRLLAGRAREVHVAFETTRRFLARQDNVRVTGNPTRASVGSVSRREGTRAFRLDEARTTVLVFGGSLGARSINDAVLHGLPGLRALGVQLLWQVGELEFERIHRELGEADTAWVKMYRFIDAMEYAYAAADIAVCRAGATTVAELTRAGVASVLVPYPFAADDHQTENANAMVEAGAAILIQDRELAVRLVETLRGLLADPPRLRALRDRARSLAKPDAAGAIARAVLQLAGEHDD